MEKEDTDSREDEETVPSGEFMLEPLLVKVASPIVEEWVNSTPPTSSIVATTTEMGSSFLSLGVDVGSCRFLLRKNFIFHELRLRNGLVALCCVV